MEQADLKPPRRVRYGIAAAIVALHVLIVVGLVRALTPDFAAEVARSVTQAFDVTITAPPPSPPPPEPSPTASQTREAGAAAPPGKKATPKEVAAPKPKIVVAKTQAPPVASTGSAQTAGAADKGDGTGAGGVGNGTGAGAGGKGTGGGAVTPLVKIAGDINSARDYPSRSRDLRLGHRVGIELTVGTDGRVTDCRIIAPSPDPQADRITCDLASRRFRFRPARNAAGQPVVGRYRWYQRWFVPGQG